jgi:hypothetical protein
MISSLAHAHEPNERLVLVTMRNRNQYLFVYTAMETSYGLDLNDMNDPIDFLSTTFGGLKSTLRI